MAERGEEKFLGRRQRRLLADSVHIEEELMPGFVKGALLALALIVLVFVVWAALTPLPEIARAPGEVIPSGEVKVVQHLDGGMVAQILVEDKKLVHAGDVLLRLDGVQAQAELRQLQLRHAVLRARAERLLALTENRVPDFEKLKLDNAPTGTDQERLYRGQRAAHESALAILDHQIEQRSNRVRQLQASLSAAREQLRVSDELVAMREELASRRLINRSTLLETQRANLSAKSEVERISQEIAVIGQELEEVRQRRLDYGHQSRREALSELGAVNGESNEVEQSIKRLQAKVERLEIRAPHEGYVHDLRVQTVGQVILPGALLMQIVPDKAGLEAVVRISTQDIGHIKVGQSVNLRATSYDYARYGFAKGTLRRVSASHLVGEDGKPYFRGWVGLTQAYVGDEAGKYPLQAGMGVVGEIRTGEKTLLAYLTKPLVNAVSGAFHER